MMVKKASSLWRTWSEMQIWANRSTLQNFWKRGKQEKLDSVNFDSERLNRRELNEV